MTDAKWASGKFRMKIIINYGDDFPGNSSRRRVRLPEGSSKSNHRAAALSWLLRRSLGFLSPLIIRGRNVFIQPPPSSGGGGGCCHGYRRSIL